MIKLGGPAAGPPNLITVPWGGKMPASIFKRLEAMANGRTLIILTVVFLGLSLVFPWVAGQLGNAGMIDSHPSYTPGEVYAIITGYGAAGRSLHLVTTLTADLFYPIDYSLLCALLIITTYRQAFPKSRMARPMTVFPFVTAIFDLLENAGIVTMISNYPQQLTLVAQVSSLFTSLKWGFFLISVVLVLMGAVGWVAARLHRQK
jgi:hypothetical protein